ncbi:hypothetical protein [Actinomadura chibensis]|uniref:SAF domain-containing protein n=1 Tax=Actinomadura chibensis TaxID=392828 RepID=A0A5D0NHQ5_9ACTN|nr:hypothetical protein [Actinomadura chibensis]TYB43869.1 hypothetical protein FXF69_23135 [Actinomadura chibensis]
MSSSSRTRSRLGLSPSASSGRGDVDGGAGRRLARQRRPGWIAAGLMLVALAVLTNVYLFRSSSDRVSVVRLARDVPVGQQLVRADVDIAWVAFDAAVATVPGRQLTQVMGKRATVGLYKGTLLAATQLTAQASPGRGQALVPVPLKASAMPPGLAPGWRVRVVFTSDAPSREAVADAGSARASVPAPDDVPAVVDQVSEPDADGLVTVSLLTSETDSSAVAREAAAEQVVLVVSERRG